MAAELIQGGASTSPVWNPAPWQYRTNHDYTSVSDPASGDHPDEHNLPEDHIREDDRSSSHRP